MNKYNDIQFNVNDLLRQQAERWCWDPRAHSGQQQWISKVLLDVFRRSIVAGLYASGLWRRLIYSHIILGWFYEFRQYWMKELEGRRLEPYDFYYLAGVYRQKFQALQLPADEGGPDFLTAWQAPASVWLLFHYQYKLALHPLPAYRLARYIRFGASVCEYGCGLAPIAQSLIKYYSSKNLRLTVADIPSVMLHFVGWKLRDRLYVRVLSIDPASHSPLDTIYDVIICMTVLEHLPQPLVIVQHLWEQLKPEGIFIFDYIKSEGTGLDAKGSLIERQQVLDFIRQHFTILEGKIPADHSSVGTIIAQKNRVRPMVFAK